MVEDLASCVDRPEDAGDSVEGGGSDRVAPHVSHSVV
jgi:hypothetical protein